MRRDPIGKLEKRALSTIEELSEQDISDSEIESVDPKNVKHSPKNPCIVTIGTEIIEAASISSENSLFDETVEEDQVASTDDVNSFWDEWRQHFTVDQFLFSLILGLIPTAWDVFSDLSFGADLASTNQIKAAGHNFKVKSGFRVSENAVFVPLSVNDIGDRHWSLKITVETVKKVLELDNNLGDRHGRQKGPWSLTIKLVGQWSATKTPRNLLASIP